MYFFSLLSVIPAIFCIYSSPMKKATDLTSQLVITTTFVIWVLTSDGTPGRIYFLNVYTVVQSHVSLFLRGTKRLHREQDDKCLGPQEEFPFWLHTWLHAKAGISSKFLDCGPYMPVSSHDMCDRPSQSARYHKLDLQLENSTWSLTEAGFGVRNSRMCFGFTSCI